MQKVSCFGELLLRMSPQLNGQWIKEANMPLHIGGAELNVANALALWGLSVEYCTALPNHYLSNEVVDALQTKNINTNAIHFSGERIGLYFLPQGADLKNAGVIYDRKYSSFYELKPGDINWRQILQGCEWFHFTAISPALSEQTTMVCKEALETAVAMGLTISIDLNYRSKLWQYGKQPFEMMQLLLPYCDVVMGNIWAAQTLLNIPHGIVEAANYSNNDYVMAATKSMEALQSRYPKVKTIAYTFRFDEQYFAVLKNNETITVSKPFEQQQVIDKVGSGDCFMAGLIYALINNHDDAAIINFAAAAAVSKMRVKGDATNKTVADIKSFIP
ncbi:PfkB family carbohydrate kinase [Ferruginibacter yonginensis]|uniref:PfkB family carbohydrate kinase n=1 Tax=Ferruginibacter yonginensis TaxID=1310416 RepID=A0ABV8QT22_9BACT